MLQMTITFKGAQLTLCGSPLHAGDRMPGFVLIDQDLKEVDSRKLSGTRIFLTVPSLDTGVCDQEVRRFHLCRQLGPAFRPIQMVRRRRGKRSADAVRLSGPFLRQVHCHKDK